ncbi:hypothetical protein [Sporolactobacillus spathodeae]|uniref:Flagellar hook-length control protein FliK n=1 Tax=Sporolactobacillus spathodeae TaxID=1465502 RepID=A0ABS2Q5M7_9BACL|nr:hypothetical protein [Sporolactobacillus spathodeae]MBM7657083.1 hypothetical protein [Sporolactobacillus spathodeae]
MAVSLDTGLLKLIAPAASQQNASSTKANESKQLSDAFAQILASSLMDNSSSQMLNALSDDTGDSTNDSSALGNADDLSTTESTSGTNDLLLYLLTQSLNSATPLSSNSLSSNSSDKSVTNGASASSPGIY